MRSLRSNTSYLRRNCVRLNRPLKDEHTSSASFKKDVGDGAVCIGEKTPKETVTSVDMSASESHAESDQ